MQKKRTPPRTLSMLVVSSGRAALISSRSASVIFPRGLIFTTPSGYHATDDLAKALFEEDNTDPKLNRCREVLQIRPNLLFQNIAAGFVSAKVDVAGRDDALLAFDGSEDLRGEFGSGVRHGERGGSRTIFGFHDFIAPELNTLDEGFVIFGREARGEGVR